MSALTWLHGARRNSAWAKVAIALPLLLLTTGCSYSPSFDILGSYFPSWMICCLGGAVATFVAHLLFTRWKLIGELRPLPLLYTGLFSFVSCSLWLIFFK